MWFYLKLVLLVCSFYAILPHENTNFIKFKNFNQEEKGLLPEDMASIHELKIWANFQQLEVLPDDPGYGLKDGMCRFVPTGGLEILLTASPDTKKTIYLFIDFAVFQPLSGYTGTLNHTLRVMVNNKPMATLFSGKEGTKSPMKISIDPVILDHGKMHVRLEPDTVSGRFWCLWDTYYSYEQF